ncbi:Cthe_2314 family HEPN domain-containing protein [Paenibacillus daejeonensis]|uniref:Cthe_2314 family HEPN domain-containing protein n=1 Tax=Paenibacillus daejeonensis TaxID=135193 RepID=UPI000360460D|nr:Cthe_2314 family HEPN domain-containing protein [Paenibacillus daejeonensis]
MLRDLLGGEPRQAEGLLLAAMTQMEQLMTELQKRIATGDARQHEYRKLEIWTAGLLGSLDELEQSQFAAHWFGKRITSRYLSVMSSEEMMDYYRHIYFDKNAFIRIFALLDKLGTFLNEWLTLDTGESKKHFSYFTVLRRMQERRIEPRLGERLFKIKETYREPMSRLRKRRNTEIHYMNSELQDDLRHSRGAYGQDIPLEDIASQLADLDQGCEMVMRTLAETFSYAQTMMRKHGKYGILGQE